MAEQVTNYQCPACTGPLHYDGSIGKLKCDYCESTYEVAEIEKLYKEKEEAAAKAAEEEKKKEQAAQGEHQTAGVAAGDENAVPGKGAQNAAEGQQTAGQAAGAGQQAGDRETASESASEQWTDGQPADEGASDNGDWDTSGMEQGWGADAEGMKSYTCPSCGAELICDATTAATSCPYCGNPSIVPGQFSGMLKPDYVIPFKLSKEDAIKALKAHYNGKPFLPKAFKSKNHIEEIKGVYVPFWLFDGKAEGNITYEATRTRVYRSGDYEVTETDHFHVYRAGSLSFERIPVDAASKMPDDHMDSIEPFDYSELKPFSTAYLPGFLADKYDVSVEDSQERADRRCRETLENSLRDTVHGYTSCVPITKNIHLKRGKVHYALLPVWMLNTKWDGKDFLFAMNGQTGRLVGDLPISWGKCFGTAAVIIAVVTAVLTTLFMLV